MLTFSKFPTLQKNTSLNPAKIAVLGSLADIQGIFWGLTNLDGFFIKNWRRPAPCANPDRFLNQPDKSPDRNPVSRFSQHGFIKAAEFSMPVSVHFSVGGMLGLACRIYLFSVLITVLLHHWQVGEGEPLAV